MICINIIVSKYAIGSLLPLSNSNIGRMLFFKIKPLERSMPNTDAESVEEKVEARSIAVAIPIPIDGNIIPDNQYINNPVTKAVKSTPNVDRTIPGQSIGFISLYLVSNPPEKSIIIKQIEPII